MWVATVMFPPLFLFLENALIKPERSLHMELVKGKMCPKTVLLAGVREAAIRIATTHKLQLHAHHAKGWHTRQNDQVRAFAQWFFQWAGQERSNLIDACIDHMNANLRYLAVLSGYCDIGQLERIGAKGKGRDRDSRYAKAILRKNAKLAGS